MMPENIILKSIGGFYYVKTPGGVIECKAKGKFRKLSLSPVAGDYVGISLEDGLNVISEILPRKNRFTRPPFANLDLMILVISAVDPLPNFLLADKMCSIACYKGAELAVAITKTDIAEYKYITDVYENAGYTVFSFGLDEGNSETELLKLMRGKLCTLAGNSGVGKSTLLNKLFPHLNLATDRTSKKLGRGKHTTRRVEIFDTGNCLVADTPGFSSIELDDENYIPRDQLQYLFPEFSKYIGKCRFADCSHTAETDCRVKNALEQGKISPSRYQSYTALYERQKNIKEWQIG